jgi:hypothetical protein
VTDQTSVDPTPADLTASTATDGERPRLLLLDGHSLA